MNRTDKITRAKALREQGLSYRAIEAEVGIPRSTLNEALNPAVAERSYERAMAGECSRCGGAMTHHRSGGICSLCRGDDLDRCVRRVERLWADGRSLEEIAGRLNCSVDSLAKRMHGYRKRGYSLPYRYRMPTPRFPEQVAR